MTKITEMNKIKLPGDTITLNNGIEMPVLGYGTYLSTDEETRSGILNAIDSGYRMIDTASYYGNEAAAGEAIRTSGIPRDELFVTTKLWNTDRGYRSTLDAFNRSLELMGLDYLDLYLIHWPANRKQFGAGASGANAETWQAFEELYKQGRVRALGVSNFMPRHLKDLYETATVNPAVNQIEFHPGLTQKETLTFCTDNDIAVQGWSPLGRRSVLDSEPLIRIGADHGKTPAQTALRWSLQHGVVPLPKSIDPGRIEENTELFDFELSGDEMDEIDALPEARQGGHPDEVEF